MAELLYVDTSAFLKLVVEEAEYDAMWEAVSGREVCSSVLLEVEAHRALLRLALPFDEAERLLATTALVMPTTATFHRARTIGTRALRTLDALHLATAVEIGAEVTGIATYDRRLAEACTAEGLAVVTPGRPDGWWRA